jgi:cytochrome c556
MSRVTWSAVVAASVLLLAPEARGTDSMSVVQSRQHLMHEMRRVGVELVGMYESGTVDDERVRKLLDRLERQSMQLDACFPIGTSSDDTAGSKALPRVWDQPREFAASMRAFQLSVRAVGARSRTEAANKLWPAIVATGNLCTACHAAFRLGGDPPHDLD